ncbi:hypothetical protein Trydic_g10566 [Trypoxylus dichotomus]
MTVDCVTGHGSLRFQSLFINSTQCRHEMFQRAKSFIIRRKRDSECDLELPDSSHLVRRPVTVSMQDRINVKLMEKRPIVKPSVDFDTLRQKSTSLEHVQSDFKKPVLQKTPIVLSSDGLDTIRRKREIQKRNEYLAKAARNINVNGNKNISKIPVLKNNLHGKEEPKTNVARSNSQKSKLFRMNSGKRKKNQDSHDQRDSFIFIKMEK